MQTLRSLIVPIIFLLMMTARVNAIGTYDMIVALDGSGDYKSIQSAIDTCRCFPDKRISIFIKNGVYKEKVRVPNWNCKLSLIGESAEHTIISYDDHFNKIDQGRNSTFFTYTLLVEGNDFYAENITIQNTAGPVGQAVALHVEGDRCTFRNCRFLGNQDTLYVAGQNTRQYYDSCYIEGTTGQARHARKPHSLPSMRIPDPAPKSRNGLAGVISSQKRKPGSILRSIFLSRVLCRSHLSRNGRGNEKNECV